MYADGLGLLIPLEIAQRNRLGREIHQQKAVLLDRLYGFLHVDMLRWKRSYAAKFGSPTAVARTQWSRQDGDYRVA